MNRVLLDFGDSQEAELLLENIRKVARIQGVSQKRIFLIGVAKYFEDVAPELVVQIADYLAMPRKKIKR